METIAHRDYVKNAENNYDLANQLAELARSPESFEGGLTLAEIAEVKKEAEAQMRRANLIERLSGMTGFDFAVYDATEMPETAGFVKTNGEQTIYISNQTLDNPTFADHVAKHEAYHLKTMLVLPVETGFTNEYFATLDRYLPKSFKENEFYLEGFNEWLTANNDEQGVEVTAYGPNVKAAQQLEALARSATGESLMGKFETGDYHGFARVLKTTTDRLMLHEALVRTDLSESEKKSLAVNVKICTEPIDSSEKADLVVDNWISTIKAQAVKKALLSSDSDRNLVVA